MYGIVTILSFFVFFSVYIFYNFEELMQDIYKMNLLEYGKSIITIYLCSVGAYGVLSYILFSVRYSRARKSLKNYYGNLRKLAGMYEK